MPLYLDEIWLQWASADDAKATLERFLGMADGQFAFPEGVRLAAGPWFSNEEAKIVVVLDIADHAKTFPAFGLGLAHGLLARRRLTPIVEWTAVRELVRSLSPT
jgi:hypothetical protein